MESSRSAIWAGLGTGICLTLASLLALPGDGIYRGFAVPAWGVWILLICGVLLCLISLRALLRGEGNEPEYTDEDIEKAKVKLEKMYMQEHGSRPEVPGEKPEAEKSEERQEK